MKSIISTPSVTPNFSFLKPLNNGVQISVLIQPRASRSRLIGEHDGRLKIQLAAPPVDGEANEALVELLCDILQLPRRRILITSGLASRRKVVLVQGVDSTMVHSTLSKALL